MQPRNIAKHPFRDYSIAGMTVAVNECTPQGCGTGLQYLLTDHLGSTVAVTNASGTLTSQQRYLPFGGTRTIPNSPILGTDFGYTGQRLLDEGMGGIMDYEARFYSPALSRFLQPDTVIPDQFNPQNWNRFSYVTNNPVKFNDPSGHNHLCGVLIPEEDCQVSPVPAIPTSPPGGGGRGGGGPCNEDDDLCWMNLNDNDNTSEHPDVDWEEVVDDLLEMADNINGDLGLEAVSALFTAGLTAAGGYVAGSLGICSVSGSATPICIILGAVGGFFTGVATESLMKNNAMVYQTLARTILQNLDNGKLNLTIVHKSAANYMLESPPGERPYTTTVHVPEHYVLQNSNGTYVPITPAQYEVLRSIINSNTGP